MVICDEFHLQLTCKCCRSCEIDTDMITTKFYLDCRAVKADVAAPLKIAITKDSKTALIHLHVTLLSNQWDKTKNAVKNHPQKRQLTTYITQRKLDIDNVIYTMVSNGECEGLTAREIKYKVLSILNPSSESMMRNTFEVRFQIFMNSKSGRTKQIYQRTFRQMRVYTKKGFSLLRFEDITKDWLTRFESYLIEKGLAKNTRNIHFRNIRAVFNDAIDNEVTTSYPFRKFKIKPEPTRKRSFTVEALRKVLTAKLPPGLELYRDFFALSFYLVGINIVDLCGLSCIDEGRVNYIRAKTHKPYSIKVEQEALDIINNHKGTDHLLYILDHYKSYRTFYTRLYKGLHEIVTELNNIDDGIVIKELSTYWARHSWATIASSLDIPKDTIAAALGHDMGNSTTAIYIDFDRTKIDEANRRVIDWVLYNKK